MSYRMVIISHGKFAEGVKYALEMIIGKQTFIETYGLKKGENPNSIIGKFTETIDQADTVVILSDLIGGSMHNAAVSLLSNENVILVGGVNLSLAIQIALTKPTDVRTIDEQIEESKNSFKRIVLERKKSDEDEDSFF
ncbi:PTS sugar transporter subunit IIA [Enterococcus sp. DIV0240d]|uniref:PTS sugar transporter subunit IIA n=1 Tax=Enterococcus sp. DIV0240d TaxID=2774717 RepID=UPI003F682C70